MPPADSGWYNFLPSFRTARLAMGICFETTTKQNFAYSESNRQQRFTRFINALSISRILQCERIQAMMKKSDRILQCCMNTKKNYVKMLTDTMHIIFDIVYVNK
jgi:hypothetical protein